MNKKDLVVVSGFGTIQGEPLDEEKFRALKFGDMIRVQLDGPEPEVRRFVGFGLRSPLIVNHYRGYNYDFCMIEGSQKNNPQTAHHIFSVDRSRVLGIAV